MSGATGCNVGDKIISGIYGHLVHFYGDRNDSHPLNTGDGYNGLYLSFLYEEDVVGCRSNNKTFQLLLLLLSYYRVTFPR
jgi:hypothetical protein